MATTTKSHDVLSDFFQILADNEYALSRNIQRLTTVESIVRTATSLYFLSVCLRADSAANRHREINGRRTAEEMKKLGGIFKHVPRLAAAAAAAVAAT